MLSKGFSISIKNKKIFHLRLNFIFSRFLGPCAKGLNGNKKGDVRKIGKERKRADRDRNSNIFGAVRKYLIGEEMGKKRGMGEEDPRGHQGPESIFHSNKQIDKEIYPLLPSLTL